MPNISLTSINSALEKKMDGTDSSSNLTDVLRLAKSADNFTSTVFYIDSSYLPTDSAFIGTLARDSDGTVYAYDGSSWTRPNKDGSITIPYIFGGTTSGYMSGGRVAPPRVDTIDKWPFASDGNATDVGDLTIARERGAGQSSKVSGYTSGGYGPSSNNNRIDKFPFAADGNATDVGDLTGTLRENAGQSSENHGYTTGGHDGSPHPGEINDIQKFSFASDENATDVGDRTITGQSHTGQNSSISGYSSAGSSGNPPVNTNVIDKFPFATDENATDVGDLFETVLLPAGQSSSTHGYVSGGSNPPVTNTIQKFSFSSDGNATDVGDLLNGVFYVCGQSSNVSGYVSGGTPDANGGNIIQKFPFPTDANSTDVGDLTQSRYGGMGQQI